ncbi:MAG: hypothetical protein ACRD26_06085, partial [Vicinamibacterales bacterium]
VIQWLDWDLAERVVAVVGASGNIGRACVSALAARVRGLILIGRNVAKLEALRESLQARTTPLDVSSLVADAARASVIVTATSAGRPLLRASALRPGTLVCDIGYPKTVEHDIDSGDVLVVQAGLAEMPFDLPLTHYTRLPNQRMMFGCFSEAMVLALSGRYESFSDYDTGITPEKLAGILALAREHGFAPAPPFSGGTRVDERRVERLCAAERSLR